MIAELMLKAHTDHRIGEILKVLRKYYCEGDDVNEKIYTIVFSNVSIAVYLLQEW